MKTLTAIQQNAVESYDKFLTAGSEYHKALQRAAKQLGDTPCITFLQALATVHAKHYKCNVAFKADGHPTFHTGKESTRDTRHGAAQVSWQRNVRVHFTVTKLGKKTLPNTKSNKLDAVKALLKKYAELTKDEQKRFLASLPR